MKIYMKSLLVMFMLCMGFVSCNDNFDEDDYKVAYPSTLAMGAWEPVYDDGSNYYSPAFSFTCNELGDTICNITLVDPETKDVFVYANGAVSYSPETGMAEVSYATSPYNAPAVAYMVYMRDLKQMAVQVWINRRGKLSLAQAFNVKAAATPVINGLWSNATLGMAFKLNADNSCLVQTGDAEPVSGQFTFANGEGSITAGDKTIGIRFNSLCQLIATVDGQEYVMSR